MGCDCQLLIKENDDDDDGQINLAHGPETKNKEKNKIKNRIAQKKRCRQKSVEAVRHN